MNIIDLLIKHEGMRLKPYRCPAGKLTIGVGHNLEDLGITRQEAIYLLKGDIDRVTNELEKFDWFGNVSYYRKMVLTDMCFNLGLTRFLGFKKMISALKAQDYEEAADEMLDSKWANDVGDRANELAKMMRRGRQF